MKVKILVTALLLTAGFLFCQNESGIDKNDIAKYWDDKNYDRFAENFIPELNPVPVKKRLASDESLFRLMVGSNSHLQVDFDLYKADSDYLNLGSSIYINEQESKWKYSGMNALWRPTINGYKPDFYSLFETREFDLQETKTTQAGLFASARHSFTFYTDIDAKAEVGMSTFKQENSGNVTINDLDMDLMLETEYKNSNIKFNPFFIASSGAFTVSAERQDVIQLDKFGLWFGADKYHVYPSVIFAYSRQFNEYMGVKVFNEPGITSRKRFENLEINPYHTLYFDKEHEKNHVDFHTVLHHSLYFPVSLEYSYKTSEDFRTYYQTAVNSPYQSTTIDMHTQYVKLSVYNKYKQFSFKYSGSYRSYDVIGSGSNIVAFQPRIINNLDVSYEQDQIKAGISFDAISQRKDYTAKKMDDAFLVHANMIYMMQKNFHISFKAYNLLDDDFVVYKNTLTNERRFELSLMFYF